ncbi:MAG: hypothetical protein K0S40_1416 [Actinomycetospora sp.]|nr:hypothetical protein [Actinomycetospora sp.]
MLHHLVEQPGGGLEDVLAVVEDEQQLAAPQVLDDRLLDREALALPHPQRDRHRVADRPVVVERRQLAEPGAVGEAGLLAGGALDGEPRLADPTDPGQRDERALAEGGDDPGHVGLPADEAGDPPGQVAHGRGGGGWRGARRCGVGRGGGDLDGRHGPGVARQDPLVDLAKPGPGVRAQFVAQPAAHLLVGVEGVGLPAAADLGEHELAGQALVERVGAEGGGDLDDQVPVPPRAQCGVVAVQGDREALGAQRGAQVREPRGVDRGERLPAPEAQRPVVERRGVRGPVGGAGLGDQLPEPVEVHRRRVGREHVTPGAAGDADTGDVGQEVPQAGHVGREGVAGPVRGLVRPHPVDEPVDRDGTAHVDEQRREDAALPGVPGVELVAVEPDVDVAQQPELDGHSRPPPRAASGSQDTRSYSSDGSLTRGFHARPGDAERCRRTVGASGGPPRRRTR